MVRGQARDLNPEAGRHEVTMDARELEAVNRASDRSWNEFPYYDAKFDERGMPQILLERHLVILRNRTRSEQHRELGRGA